MADQRLHTQAAYIIGKLRVAGRASAECAFLQSCLKSDVVKTRGVALKALAQLGITDYRRECEWIATDAWDKLAKSKAETSKALAQPKKADERMMLRTYALESLRLIGDGGSIEALRDARNWRPDGTNDRARRVELMQLSYEVSEDVYWRVTGGLEGDFYDSAERPAKPQLGDRRCLSRRFPGLPSSMPSSASTRTARSAPSDPDGVGGLLSKEI